MLPEGWITRRFDQFGNVLSGSTPSTTTRAYWDGSIVWVTPNDLSKLNTPYLHDSAKHITEEGLRACSATLVRPGSIVISSRAPIGYVAIPTVEFCTNQGCKSIELRPGFDSEYAYYNITFNIEKLKHLGEGTTFAEISKTALTKVKLQFPADTVEQSKIAEVLSTVDRAIEQTEALIAKQQRIKTGLMHDLLTRGIDENGNLRSKKTHEFKDSPLGRIPVEWDAVSLGQIAQVKGGKRLPEGHSYAEDHTGFVYLRVLDFYHRDIDASSLKCLHRRTFSELARYEIRDRDLCISIAGSIGHVAVFRTPTGIRAVLTENALRIVPSNTVIPEFLCAVMNGHKVQAQIEAQKGTGGGVPKLALFRVQSLLVALPRQMDEQDRIVQVLDAQERCIRSSLGNHRKLQHLKTGLMQDLLTGKVRVTPLLEKTRKAVTS